MLSLAIVTGAIWADATWGHFWSWEPAESWTLVIWFLYAGLLESRLAAGWRGTACGDLDDRGLYCAGRLVCRRQPAVHRASMGVTSARPMREAIFIFGVNHRETPVAVRERLAYAEGEIVGALARLKQAAPAIHEVALISTCNRVEIIGRDRGERSCAQ